MKGPTVEVALFGWERFEWEALCERLGNPDVEPPLNVAIWVRFLDGETIEGCIRRPGGAMPRPRRSSS